MKISEVTGFLDQCFPRENALDYDNVGILAGDPDRVVTACVLSLDLTTKAIDFARQSGADLIITHHPVIFGGIKTLSAETSKGRLLSNLIRSGISCYACHTNLDMTDEFGNLAIASALGAEEPSHLEGTECGIIYEIKQETLKVFCERTKKALGASGIITINNPENKVSKIFLQGGAFDEDSIPAVIKSGADTVLSGEIKHHVCVELEECGINTVIAGHSATEQIYLPKLREKLSQQFPSLNFIVNYNNEKASVI
ncbi:MAG: Nif3-like dinuclear metal center hexameric protein [Clostridiales bacterium]|nr:Nif3-like dinuclear metal center hexameric protein [Clostridiales bacterium]MBR6487384.1 Nif3-like dinuclear metal center hexameric protein [Clostridiales bacterium]